MISDNIDDFTLAQGFRAAAHGPSATTSARSRLDAPITLLVFNPQAVAAARKPCARVNVSMLSVMCVLTGCAVGLKPSASVTKPACAGSSYRRRRRRAEALGYRYQACLRRLGYCW